LKNRASESVQTDSQFISSTKSESSSIWVKKKLSDYEVNGQVMSKDLTLNTVWIALGYKICVKTYYLEKKSKLATGKVPKSCKFVKKFQKFLGKF